MTLCGTRCLRCGGDAELIVRRRVGKARTRGCALRSRASEFYLAHDQRVPRVRGGFAAPEPTVTRTRGRRPGGGPAPLPLRHLPRTSSVSHDRARAGNLYACWVSPSIRASPLVRARYDDIGYSYSMSRREDPRIAAQIHAALGPAGRWSTSAPGRATTNPLIERSSRLIRRFGCSFSASSVLDLWCAPSRSDCHSRTGCLVRRSRCSRCSTGTTVELGCVSSEGRPHDQRTTAQPRSCSDRRHRAAGSGSANPTILARRRAGQQVAAPQSRGCRDATPSFVQE